MRAMLTFRLAGESLHITLRGAGTDKQGSLPVGTIMHLYWRELQSWTDWFERQRRNDEWYALKEWRRCQTREERTEVERLFGEVLQRALHRWRSSETYQAKARKRAR